MKKSLSLILTALLLVFVLVSCGPSGGTNDTGSQTDTPTETPTETPTQQIQVPTEQATEAPTEQGSTNPDADKPEGIKYLRSNTGTQLNMILEYDVAKNENGSYTVDATLKLESYSLNVTARGNSNYLKIGDENYYFATEAINYSGEEKTTFTLSSHRFTVSGAEKEVPVYAIWYFNGTYNDAPLAAIVIDGTITLE